MKEKQNEQRSRREEIIREKKNEGQGHMDKPKKEMEAEH